MEKEQKNNAPFDRARICELVEKTIDLGRADESAKEIAEMLFLIAPKGLQDGYQYNLALEGAKHAYLFTSHFEESFDAFMGIPDAGVMAHENRIEEIAEQEM